MIVAMTDLHGQQILNSTKLQYYSAIITYLYTSMLTCLFLDVPTTSSDDCAHPEANKDEVLTRWLCTQGANEDQLLAVAAVLTSEIREAVRKETGFTCSAGISHNKVINVYVCSLLCVLCICVNF